MIHGLYQSAGGMMVQMENNQVISENLGAAAVPGFRRSVASFDSILKSTGKLQVTNPTETPETYQPNPPSWQTTVPNIKTSTDFSAGHNERDGNFTHFAISGPGFFAIETPDGKTAYTKNGSFTINAEGQIITSDGWKVLTAEGTPITLKKTTEVFSVNEDGELFQEGTSLGKMQMAKFNDPTKDLEWMGGRYFLPANNATPDTADTSSKLLQGYLESSNVNVVHEMVSMIQAMRLYESNQKMLQAQDSSLEQTIRQVPNR